MESKYSRDVRASEVIIGSFEYIFKDDTIEMVEKIIYDKDNILKIIMDKMNFAPIKFDSTEFAQHFIGQHGINNAQFPYR